MYSELITDAEKSMKENYEDSETEREASALIDQLRTAIGSALEAVETANRQVCEELSTRGDPIRRSVITQHVEQEVAESPGWLDEVIELMTGLDNEEGTADSFQSDGRS